MHIFLLIFFLVLEGVVQYFLQSVNGETTEVDFRLPHVSILYCYTISRFWQAPFTLQRIDCRLVLVV